MTALCRRVPRYSSHGVMWSDRVGLHHLTAHSQCAASAASASTTFLVPKVGFEPTDSSVWARRLCLFVHSGTFGEGDGTPTR
jgi:putative lipase involved disintegration of autophagic bodies